MSSKIKGASVAFEYVRKTSTANTQSEKSVFLLSFEIKKLCMGHLQVAGSLGMDSDKHQSNGLRRSNNLPAKPEASALR